MAVMEDHAAIGLGQVPPATEKYVRELDGLRAIAVSIVVLAHYHLLLYVPGGFGVTLFFFLSGYLITTLFYAEYALNRRISVPQFYVRRWLRLTPSLVISIVLGVALFPITRVAVGGTPVPAGTIFAAMLYYTNYYDLAWGLEPSRVIPFGICWSLAVEEHFYLIWPWVMRRTIHDPHRLALIVMLLCTAVMLWRCIARFAFSVPVEYTGFATDCRIDSILYGALLRILFQTAWASAVVRVARMRACRIIAALALLLAFIIRNDDFRETVRYSIQGIALMPLFTAVLADPPTTLARRALASRPMVLVGRLSYSIYLFHLLARTPGEVYFVSPDRWGAAISGLLLTGTIAYILFMYVERPMARLRHRFRHHSPSQGAGPSADHLAALSISTLPRNTGPTV